MRSSIKNKRKIFQNKFCLTVIVLSMISLNIAYAESLKVCYEASLLFKVGESCIEYQLSEGDILKLESKQHTTGIVDAASHLEQRVTADIALNPLVSRYLYFYEKNKRKSMTHHYMFQERLIYSGNSFRYKDHRYKNARKTFDKEGVLDPAAAVMYFQLNMNAGEGSLKTFFEGKYIDITYSEEGHEEITFNGEKYGCSVIDFVVPVSTSSLVTPTGVWRIYIDDETGIIMRLELKFPLGSAKLKPVLITGNREILKKYIARPSKTGLINVVESTVRD
ncbi:DUF3108 domain-containing protein [Deferribacteres bacterium DY0037]